jgi:hypothetical protein
MYEWRPAGIILMVYSGVSYASFVRPAKIEHFGTIHGVEIRSPSVLGRVFGKPATLYAADNLSFTGVPTYYGSNNLECGVKLGDWSGSGIRIFASYYYGLDLFHQYYDVHRESWGVGVAFDFW